MHQKHFEKGRTLNDKTFIQPTVITLKKERSVKIALDAGKLNRAIGKDKYQMPNMNHLSELFAEQLETPDGEDRLTSLDMQYAYGQIPLDTKAAEQCNFQNSGGEATGTYTFSTGFYGLTTMPSKFQKILAQV